MFVSHKWASAEMTKIVSGRERYRPISATVLNNFSVLLNYMPLYRIGFLPARRYASAGYRDRNVSVCLSVCPSRAGIVSKRRKLAA